MLIRDRKAFSLAQGKTQLGPSDYRFLKDFSMSQKRIFLRQRSRYLVEGDAENILLPTLARLIHRDFLEYGVSLVNVGSVGLRRYANIFLRADAKTDGELQIPVACITDMDVMPDCAPWIIGKLKEEQTLPEVGTSIKRKWRVKKDFTAVTIADHREKLQSKATGQRVKTFVADEWDS